jgi:3-oxoacyl-[acyl-carrier protein] reductase
MDIEGKAAIITGSSSGVGAALALKLADAGCDVLVNYAHSREAAEDVAGQVEACGVRSAVVQADVKDDAQCKAMVEHAIKTFGRLDILVNNAGTTFFVEHENLEQLTDEIWRTTIDTNLMGAFYMSRAAIPHIQAQGGGEIVMTSSTASLDATGSSIAYCASKAALNSLTKTLARSFGPANIRVNAVAPGLIDSGWSREGWAERWDDVKAFVEQKTPLGAFCTPEDVADCILSIITGPDLVTGQILAIEGGVQLTF